MYRINNRSPFATYNSSLEGTRANSKPFAATDKQYFSSINAEIYFNEYYIDDITSIQYSVEQRMIGIYGYNSYVFDEMAIGDRTISGSFIINFTEPNYLINLLAEIENSNLLDMSSSVSKEEDGSLEEDDVKVKSFIDVKQGKRPIWYQSFDIDVMIGQDTTKSSAKHVMLENVYLQSCQTILDGRGTPIQEMYQFIARDIRPIV